MIIRSIDSQKSTEVSEKEDLEKSFLSKSNSKEDKLPKDVLFDDQKSDNAKLIFEAANHNLSLFVPDTLFLNLVNNFRNARKLYGDTLIHLLTGFDPDYIERNLKIPEFKKTLKDAINRKVRKLKKEGFVDENFNLTELAYDFALLETSIKELENIKTNSFSFRMGTVKSKEGLIDDVVKFTGDSLKNIAIKNTIKKAISRNHKEVLVEDLSVYERVNDNKVETIICIDASSSMKGEKIANSKKAALTLAYASLKNKDSVGLLVFQDKVLKKIKPTRRLKELLPHIARIQTRRMTNISLAIKEAIPLFDKNVTKNLLIITDAMPTSGKKPLDETLKAALLAKHNKIHLAIVGVSLNKETTEITRKIIEIAEGTLYVVKNSKNLNKVLIEEYYSLKSKRSFI